MKQEKLKNRGITLIALIITIIVMLILVAVTISVALNGGLIGKAQEAKTKTEEAQIQERDILTGRIKIGDTWYDSLDKYLEGVPSKVQPKKAYGDAGTDGYGFLTENAEYTEGGKTAVIPKGFKISDVAEEQTIDGGLVIQDSDGNEFVWIPVDVPAEKTFDDVFYRSEWEDNERVEGLSTSYKELYSKGDAYEKADYKAMKTSVKANKGFYIGRYEAGSVDEDGQPLARTGSSSTRGKMVVKRDQYPFSYVKWGGSMTAANDGATYVCRHFYDDKKEKIGVTSTLCYGVQWDAILDFIKSEKDVSDSSSWGNYKDNSFTIDRQEAQFAVFDGSTLGEWQSISEETGNKKEKSNSDDILLTTGASDNFAVKNIYDIAGNCREWTWEAYSTIRRVLRGGCCASSGGTASERFTMAPNCVVQRYYSFRPALYINE